MFNLSSVASAETISLFDAFVESMLSPEDGVNTVNSALQIIAGRMDLDTAAKSVQNTGRPKDVTMLITSVSGNEQAPLDEASLEKARLALNELIEKAGVELDDKIFVCKGIERAMVS